MIFQFAMSPYEGTSSLAMGRCDPITFGVLFLNMRCFRTLFRRRSRKTHPCELL